MELFLSTAKPPTAVACALEVVGVKDVKVSQGKLPFTELKHEGYAKHFDPLPLCCLHKPLWPQ